MLIPYYLWNFSSTSTCSPPSDLQPRRQSNVQSHQSIGLNLATFQIHFSAAKRLASARLGDLWVNLTLIGYTRTQKEMEHNSMSCHHTYKHIIFLSKCVLSITVAHQLWNASLGAGCPVWLSESVWKELHVPHISACVLWHLCYGASACTQCSSSSA